MLTFRESRLWSGASRSGTAGDGSSSRSVTGMLVGGLAVHIGARISSLAGPGEVLVSCTVRDLVVGADQTLTDRDEHQLKGIPAAWRLFAVET
jgi:class 3 adenylate cyclase